MLNMSRKLAAAMLLAFAAGLGSTAIVSPSEARDDSQKVKMEKVKPPALVKKRLSPGEAQGFNPQPDIPGKTKTTINPGVNPQGSKQQ
jgi:hypothetical protein